MQQRKKTVKPKCKEVAFQFNLEIDERMTGTDWNLKQ